MQNPGGRGHGGGPAGAGADTERRTVWIVDDSPAVLLLARCAFERAGWTVETFEDLATAYENLTGAEAPDAVLLDIHLPDGNGLDHVRTFTRAGSAVVMVSNVAGPDQLETAFAAGAEDAIQKPFDLRSLVARTERAVKGRVEAPADRGPAIELISSADGEDLLTLDTKWQ